MSKDSEKKNIVVETSSKKVNATVNVVGPPPATGAS